MEYIEGDSLADVVEKFGIVFDEKLIVLYTREIFLGLKYLNQNGIVHSDLKCKNVPLSLSGKIKLADFGCVKRLINLKNDKVSLQSCKGIVGTPLWMAPEVLRNEELEVVADIRSLGCTFIEMATDRPPWDGDMLNPWQQFKRLLAVMRYRSFLDIFLKRAWIFCRNAWRGIPGF